MQANSDQLKQYLAHTLAPAARQVKSVHKSLEEKVDVGFGCVQLPLSGLLTFDAHIFSIGVLSFDDACKKMEQVSLHDEEDIKHAYMQSQVNILSWSSKYFFDHSGTA